jgi:hypothetical protein
MARRYNDPADYVFDPNYSIGGCYLFDDGTVGCIGDPDFEIDEDYFEDEDEYEYYDKTGRVPQRLWENGREPIGNIYIDRYGGIGDFLQGDCFWYYEGETLRDWCIRNGYPLPVLEVPEEVYEALEDGNVSALREYARDIPELKYLLR